MEQLVAVRSVKYNNLMTRGLVDVTGDEEDTDAKNKCGVGYGLWIL